MSYFKSQRPHILLMGLKEMFRVLFFSVVPAFPPSIASSQPHWAGLANAKPSPSRSSDMKNKYISSTVAVAMSVLCGSLSLISCLNLFLNSLKKMSLIILHL